MPNPGDWSIPLPSQINPLYNFGGCDPIAEVLMEGAQPGGQTPPFISSNQPETTAATSQLSVASQSDQTLACLLGSSNPHPTTSLVAEIQHTPMVSAAGPECAPHVLHTSTPTSMRASQGLPSSLNLSPFTGTFIPSLAGSAGSAGNSGPQTMTNGHCDVGMELPGQPTIDFRNPPPTPPTSPNPTPMPTLPHTSAAAPAGAYASTRPLLVTMLAQALTVLPEFNQMLSKYMCNGSTTVFVPITEIHRVLLEYGQMLLDQANDEYGVAAVQFNMLSLPPAYAAAQEGYSGSTYVAMVPPAVNQGLDPTATNMQAPATPDTNAHGSHPRSSFEHTNLHVPLVPSDNQAPGLGATTSARADVVRDAGGPTGPGNVAVSEIAAASSDDEIAQMQAPATTSVAAAISSACMCQDLQELKQANKEGEGGLTYPPNFSQEGANGQKYIKMDLFTHERADNKSKNKVAVSDASAVAAGGQVSEEDDAQDQEQDQQEGEGDEALLGQASLGPATVSSETQKVKKPAHVRLVLPITLSLDMPADGPTSHLDIKYEVLLVPQDIVKKCTRDHGGAALPQGNLFDRLVEHLNNSTGIQSARCYVSGTWSGEVNPADPRIELDFRPDSLAFMVTNGQRYQLMVRLDGRVIATGIPEFVRVYASRKLRDRAGNKKRKASDSSNAGTPGTKKAKRR